MEFRSASNDLPSLRGISLQDTIRTFDSAQQTAALQTTLRDLQLSQLRMAAPLAVLNDQYRRTLAAYLGESGGAATSQVWIKNPPQKPGAGATLKKLDALDAQRHALEATVQADILTRQSRQRL